jgi:hypothetical protein
MPGAPQVGFSPVMDRMSFRSSAVILGRPALRRESNRQYHRKPTRCRLTTVSGFTTTSTLAHFDQQRRRPSPKRRSGQPGSGVLALEDSDRLPDGDVLQSQVMSPAEEGTEPREKTQKKPNHGPIYRTQSAEGRFVQAAEFAKKSDFDDPQPRLAEAFRCAGRNSEETDAPFQFENDS